MLGDYTAFIDRIGEHVSAYFLGSDAPPGGQRVLASHGGDSRAGVGGHPAGHLREGEVLRAGSHLPDALVGFAPVLERAFHLSLHDPPQPIFDSMMRPGVKVDRAHDRAPDVVLTLLVRGVANADGPRPLVSGQM